MLHRWIVSAASHLVPRADRLSWRAEWEAELAHREQRRATWARRGPDLVWRSLGAFRDAWTLQLGRWHSARFFAHHWRLTATAVLSLGAAIAATVVGLSIGDVLLRRPPGVADPGTLRTIDIQTKSNRFGEASYDEFKYYRSSSKTFGAITAHPYSISTIGLRTATHNQQALATQVADNFFEVLGVRAMRGTLAFPRLSEGIAIVIAERLWQALDRPAIGTALRLNDNPVTLTGVLPSSFRGMAFVWEPDVWMSFESGRSLVGEPALLTDRSRHWLHMVGRLSPASTTRDAEAELRVLASRLERAYPADGLRTTVLSPTTVTPAGDRSWMWQWIGALVGVVLLMLIVACANVTNLLLGLSLARRHEMLVRAAMGAGRRHLILPLVRESVAIAAMAGALGYLMAFAALARLATFHPAMGPFLPAPAIDARPGLLVAGVVFLLVMLCGVLIGIGPALKAADEGLSAMLNRTSTTRHTSARLRSSLVLIQMAVVTVVLVVLGVGISSVIRLSHADLGFSARHLAFTPIDLRASGYDQHTGPAAAERFRQRIEGLPGVESVSFVDGPPLGNGWSRARVSTPEQPLDPKNAASVRYSVVDPLYFSTMGVMLLAGRPFDSRDTATSPDVVIVNAAMARQLWPNIDPIGRTLRIGDNQRMATVVGVAADGKYEDVSEEQETFMYRALTQHYLDNVIAIARTAPAGPTPLAIAQALFKSEPGIVLSGFALLTLDDLLALSRFLPTMVATVATIVSIVTLILAISGLYGSVFYSVGQRRHELRVRMMLGAVSRDVYRIAIRTMGGTAVAGAAIGIAVAIAVLPAVSSMFYGIRPIEPLITGLVAAAGIAVVLLTTVVAVRPVTKTRSLISELTE
jgi:putative ABC transport system permease protein